MKAQIIKPVSFTKNGVEYTRCKLCPDKSEKFRSTTAHVPHEDEFLYSAFNGINWAIENGYTLKRFTITT